jgi:sugar phosphate permease
MMRPAKTWYRGWTMVLIGLLTNMVVVGSTTYAFGLYVVPVTEDMGLSRATANTGLIFQHLGTAALAPVIGRFLDRVSLRLMVAISGLALGAALIVISIGDTLWLKASMLALPVSFAVLAGGTLPGYVLIARWFSVHRGRAMLLVALGQSGSSIMLSPLLAFAIARLGWRDAMFFQGLAVAVIMVLLAWLMRDKPTEADIEPGSEAISPEAEAERRRSIGHPIRVMAILGRPIFWVLAIIIAISLAVIQAMLASIVPLATQRGFTLVQGAALMSTLGLSAVGGKLVLAMVADRVRKDTLMLMCVVITLGFVFSLSLERGYPFLVFSCLLSGVAMGSFFPIYAAVLAEKFGANSLGTAEGLTSPIVAITSAVAIHIAGVSFDATGDYRVTFLIFTGCLCVALAAAIGVRFGDRRRLPPSTPVLAH